MNQMPYVEARKLVTHPVACIDCHDPETMQLRVTRPGFIEGIRALKACAGRAELRREHAGDAPGDARVRLRAVPRRVLLQGRRRSGSPTRGRRACKIENILAYYDEAGFKDWTHAETGAPVLKAQHPEFEMWNQGIHAPHRRRLRRLPHAVHARGGAEDQRPPRAQPAAQHQPRLPDLPQVAGGRAAEPRRRDPGPHLHLRNLAMDAVVGLIADTKAARAAGRPDAELAGRVAAAAARAVPARLRRGGELDRASTRPRRPPASSARPSTSRGRARCSCATRRFKPQHAPSGMGEPTPPDKRGQAN